MNRADARDVCQAARNRLRPGLADDALAALLDGVGDESTPDTVFRALMLDERFSLVTAEHVWLAARELAGKAGG